MSGILAGLKATKRITVEKYDGATGTLIGTETQVIEAAGDDALAELNNARAARGLRPLTMAEAIQLANREA